MSIRSHNYLWTHAVSGDQLKHPVVTEPHVPESSAILQKVPVSVPTTTRTPGAHGRQAEGRCGRAPSTRAHLSASTSPVPESRGWTWSAAAPGRGARVRPGALRGMHSVWAAVPPSGPSLRLIIHVVVNKVLCARLPRFPPVKREFKVPMARLTLRYTRLQRDRVPSCEPVAAVPAEGHRATAVLCPVTSGRRVVGMDSAPSPPPRACCPGSSHLAPLNPAGGSAPRPGRLAFCSLRFRSLRLPVACVLPALWGQCGRQLGFCKACWAARCLVDGPRTCIGELSVWAAVLSLPDGDPLTRFPVWWRPPGHTVIFVATSQLYFAAVMSQATRERATRPPLRGHTHPTRGQAQCPKHQ